MISMPSADRVTKIRMRTLYGILCMKYGAHSFVRNEGMTSHRRTTPFGTEGADEIESGGEDDHVEDIVDETWGVLVVARSALVLCN